MADFIKTTEQSSLYDNLEKMSIGEILKNINQEDQKVAIAVQKVIPQIEKLVEKVVEKLAQGGRLFYMGAGTSGRLGILDASECPPTFGVSKDLVIGLIAGGDNAIRNAVEKAEDNPRQAVLDLETHQITSQDVLVGIAASGTTPYVLGAIDYCQENNIITGGITCNEGSPLAIKADFPMVAVVGPEFVTGSSRMKAGTAQKLILNMITTSTMIQLGRVKGNRMVDMQLSNEKLVQRGTQMIVEASSLDAAIAKEYLLKYGSVRAALKVINND